MGELLNIDSQIHTISIRNKTIHVGESPLSEFNLKMLHTFRLRFLMMTGDKQFSLNEQRSISTAWPLFPVINNCSAFCLYSSLTLFSFIITLQVLVKFHENPSNLHDGLVNSPSKYVFLQKSNVRF